LLIIALIVVNQSNGFMLKTKRTHTSKSKKKLRQVKNNLEQLLENKN